MKRKQLKYYALSYTFCICIIASVLIQHNNLNIIDDQSFILDSYSDKDEGGKSSSSIQSFNPVKYTYQINNHIKFPYAGIYFEDSLERKKIDLSEYNQITISISGTKAKQIPFTLNTLWNLKNRPYQKILRVTPKLTTHTFSIHELTTPDWWLNKNNVIDDKAQPFEKVITINFEGSKQLAHGVEDQIIIKQIIFSTNNTNTYIVLSFFWLVGITIIGIIYLFNKNKNFIPIKSVEYESPQQNNHEELVINYIGNNYTNPNLSLLDITRNTKVKSNDVSKVLMQKYSLSFKEYLNYVRLSEAKNLLKNANLNISEIAYSVGYNNVTHFNRVFKNSENQSPKEFRNN